MAVYGEQWRQARKLLTTHMLTVKKVQAYRPGREEEVRTAMARLRWAATANDTVVDMSDLLYSFTTGLMYRAVSGESDDGRNRHIRELLDATVKLVGGFYPESFFPWLGHVGAVRRATYARAEKVKRRWNELFDAMIDDAGKPTPAKQRQPEGFIRQLLSHQRDHGLPREHIKGMLINVFFGGTDTSYMVLEFMVAELIRNPNAMHKLQAELRSRVPGKREVVTEDDLTDMTYLRAVIKETLRLHPPAPLLEPHLSMDRLQIDGYTIPANISVIVNAWAIGRDETVWEDAEEFKPERFIGSEVTFKGNDFELLPFSAGRRICPGVNFSMATLEIMVANLMYHFDWKLPEGMEANGIDMTEVFSSTLHRKEKLLLVPKHVLINNIIGCDN
uniref:Cytochrome P450 n=2 Tax=Oryza brachyantha TaxID=4533 RepID=J3MPM9_ORYBR